MGTVLVCWSAALQIDVSQSLRSASCGKRHAEIANCTQPSIPYNDWSLKQPPRAGGVLPFVSKWLVSRAALPNFSSRLASPTARRGLGWFSSTLPGLQVPGLNENDDGRQSIKPLSNKTRKDYRKNLEFRSHSPFG